MCDITTEISDLVYACHNSQEFFFIRLSMVPESRPSRIGAERIYSEPDGCNQKLVSVFILRSSSLQLHNE